MAVLYDRSDGRATITLNDPERRNPMSISTMDALLKAMRRASTDHEIKVIVLTGAGEAFSAGGDLSGGFVDDPMAQHRARGLLADVFRVMRRGGKPIVAKVNGHALAGGFGLVCASDIVVAANTARFGCPEVGVGLWPMMITAVMREVMSQRAALELMLTGRLVDAEEARSLGAVNTVVPESDLDDAVNDVVGSLLARSSSTIALGRDAFYSTSGMGFDASLDRLQLGLTNVASSEDASEGVAAFLEKRDPDWKGR